MNSRFCAGFINDFDDVNTSFPLVFKGMCRYPWVKEELKYWIASKGEFRDFTEKEIEELTTVEW
jgi:hypothetical protein